MVDGTDIGSSSRDRVRPDTVTGPRCGTPTSCRPIRRSTAGSEDILDRLEELWPSGEVPGRPPAQLGRFTIVRELGRGGFGVVFLAEDPDLGRLVALKVPRIEVLSHGESWRRFLREARAASRLDHPNLVPILEAGELGPAAYIASVFVDGPSLADWLKGREGPVNPRMAARLVATLARAMEHAHQRSILHLDLKPANVLLHPGERIGPGDGSEPAAVNRDGLPFVPRICDFGLAKLMDVEGRRVADDARRRLAAVHGPRAGRVAQGSDRAGDRRLWAGGDPVRAPDRPPSVRRQEPARDPATGRRR